MGMLGCADTARLQRACELSLGGGVCGLTCLPSMGEEALGSRLTNARHGLEQEAGAAAGALPGTPLCLLLLVPSQRLSLPPCLAPAARGMLTHLLWLGLGGGGGAPWPPRLLPPPPPCSGSAAGAAACRALWRAPAGSSGTP